MTAKEDILIKFNELNFAEFTTWLFRITINKDSYYNTFEKMLNNKDFGEKTDTVKNKISDYYISLEDSLEGLVESYEEDDKFEQIKYNEQYNNLMGIDEIELDEIDAGLLGIKLSKMKRGSKKLKKELDRIIEKYAENEFFYKVIEPYNDELDSMYNNFDDDI